MPRYCRQKNKYVFWPVIYADGLQIISQVNALFSYSTHLNTISFLCNLLMFFVVLAIQNNIKA